MKNRKSAAPRAQRSKNPVVLVILDGWGIAPPSKFNAISIAKKPNFDALSAEFGVSRICASGPCVGLTEGQMGNSEVGHLTIGAGRVIFQDLMRVFEEIKSGKLAKNAKLLRALRSLKKREGTLHFLGLLSDGGVHSHIDHLFALLDIARKLGIEKVAVHAFLDGRDTPPRSGVDYLASLTSFMKDFPNATIASVSGRYYAMDRDNRWGRTKLAYDAIVYGEGEKFEDPIFAVKQSYSRNENDEFIIPIVNMGYQGMKEGDLVIFFNFRPDRARQLTRALSANAGDFGGLFDRSENKRPKKVEILTMTLYDPKLKGPKALLGRERVSNTLSNVLEKKNLRQLRIAETEKYAHVTYFFNGLVEKPRRFEERILIPSQKVETYDKSPEMSAREITEQAVKSIDGQRFSFILINLANADMVGHSGMIEPTVKAVETVDQCLGEIIDTWRKQGDRLNLIVTADHGNAEKMFDERTGQPHTAHTANLVPLIVVSKKWKTAREENYDAGLRDIAPTILNMMGIAKPKAMTGKSLV
ncbi:MAG: 2,3-bisphosphoglycerate-independent phosphoglycerate mutase [Thaumarchaeota archaeon]|nr:2,3-bisphosphoglycerate-independent phosphoglycerate mutase [Nitrososphaerota archaeon]